MRIFDPLPQGKILSIMPTWQCTAACTHCGTLSSPREKTRLPVEYMLSAIDQAAHNGYEVVVFTGGEPTLAGPTLYKAIRRTAERGLIARVVSNAFWAKTDDRAERVVGELVAAGLVEINFSTGDQHARFVPLENVLRATRSSVKAGLTTAIMVELVSERIITRKTVEEHPLFQELHAELPLRNVWIDESPWMPLSPDEPGAYPEELVVNARNVAARTGCDSVLATTTVEADGSIGACCGLGMRLIPELQLGNIRDTTLAEADGLASDDFLKRWLRVEGPEQILAWAAGHDPAIQWENMYAHRCQACLRIYQDSAVRRVIREHHREKIADVVFGEWLLFHYSGATPTDKPSSTMFGEINNVTSKPEGSNSGSPPSAHDS